MIYTELKSRTLASLQSLRTPRTGRRWITALAAIVGLGAVLADGALAAPQIFGTSFPAPFDNVKTRYSPLETSPMRALALSNDGSQLYALNQAGSRLAVFDVASGNLVFEIPAGIALVAVVPRPGTSEIWMVDTGAAAVSVVDANSGEILHTVRVGAEPHGLVFSDNADRAFVTCSGVHRLDVVDTATYQVANSLDLPGTMHRGVEYHAGSVFIAPFLSGNNTAPRGAGLGNLTNDVVEVRRVSDFPSLASLPDRDLIVVRATGAVGQETLDLPATQTGLGNVLFNVHKRPGTNELWIPNTEALNATHVGERNFPAGQVVQNRLTIVDSTGASAPVIIDLDLLAPNAASRIAQPTAVAFDPTRNQAYVCGYGTDRVAVLSTAGPQPTWLGHIEVIPIASNPPTAGPRDCIVSPDGSKLFILNKIDSTLTTVDLTALPAGGGFVHNASAPDPLGFDPVPLKVRRGRSHANNARFSASQTSSCDSCHVDGHTDGLVWDLSAYEDPEGTANHQLAFGLDVKGPLKTQSLRALIETGPWHWRGEKRSLLDFNAAFAGLLENQVGGQASPLANDQFAYIIFYMGGFSYPPNALQPHDRRPTTRALLGSRIFARKPVLGSATCASCHQLPLGTANEIVASTEGTMAKTIVTPQLRGVAEKLSDPHVIGGDFGTRTELGAGLGHGGVRSSFIDFLRQEPIATPGVRRFNLTPAEELGLETFLEEFDTGLAPSTGFQVTANAANAAAVEAGELAHLIEQARAGHCDLIFRRGLVPVGGHSIFEAGLFDPASGLFLQARAGAPAIDPHQLILDAQNAGRPVTFSGVPLWMGRPMALDRDMDDILDHDELLLGTELEFFDTDNDGYPDGYELTHGSDPKVPNSTIADSTAPALVGTPRLVYATQSSIKFEFELDELARIYLSLNGGPVVQRLPIGPRYDRLFSPILGGLQPGTSYTIQIRMFDAAGNTAIDSVTFQTPPRQFPDPVYASDILPSITGTGPHTLSVQVTLEQDGAPAPDGYTARGNVFQQLANGTLVPIANGVTAVTAGGTGLANFNVALPAKPGIASTLTFVLEDALPPVGLPPYVRALSAEILDRISY